MITTQIKHIHTGLALFLIFLCTAISGYTCSPAGLVAMEFDREVYRYIGMMISKGSVVGREVFDHKPPFTYFLAYLGGLLNIGGWGIWLVQQMFMFIAALALFFTAKKILNAPMSLFFALLYIVIIGYEMIVANGFTRIVTSSLSILTLSAAVHVHRAYRFGLIGFLISLIFITLPNDIFGLFPIYLFLILYEDIDVQKLCSLKKIIVRLLLTFIFFLIPILCVLWYYAEKDALQELWFHSYQFNVQYYFDYELSAWDKFHHTIYGIFLSIPRQTVFLIIFVSFFLGLFLLFWRHEKKYKYYLLAIMFAFVFQFIAISLSGKGFRHYIQSLIPFWFLLLIYQAYLLKKMRHLSWFNMSISTLYMTALIVFFLMIGSLRAIHNYKGGYFGGPYRLDEGVKERLSKAVSDGHPYPLYNFDYGPYLAYYTDFNIMAPTKWVLNHFYCKDKNGAYFDADGTYFSAMIDSINSKKTLYIIDRYHHLKYRVYKRKDLIRKWRTFVREHYDHVYSFDSGASLFKRKEEEPTP